MPSVLQGDTYIEMMSREEAESKISIIRISVMSMRMQLLDFDQRLGWKALGYESMKDCLIARFGKTFQTGYRQLLAAKVETNIRRVSPMGEFLPDGGIPERHVRDTGIAKLATPQLQAEAYENAARMATLERQPVTAAHVKKSVEIIAAREAVFQTPYHVIGHMVTQGEITALVGQEMTEAIDGLKPARLRGFVMELIAKHGLTCPALIAPLGEMFSRLGTDRQSKTLDVILASGHVAGIPLRTATMQDLARAKREAQQEYIAEGQEAKRLGDLASGKVIVVNKVISLPMHDWVKCVEVLRDELGDNGFERLMRAGMAI